MTCILYFYYVRSILAILVTVHNRFVLSFVANTFISMISYVPSLSGSYFFCFILQSPNSVVVCNHIGNFWRIRGSTYHAIECFRRALHFSPNDADALLNLGKVLFNLNYMQDAVHLARRSLEMQPSGHNCWLQHFTLGEILRASGDWEEAVVHFRQALDLNPSFELAELHLREIGSPSASTTNTYTFLVIGLLVVVVLATVYFMTLTSENRGTKGGRAPLWVDGKRARKRPLS